MGQIIFETLHSMRPIRGRGPAASGRAGCEGGFQHCLHFFREDRNRKRAGARRHLRSPAIAAVRIARLRYGMLDVRRLARAMVATRKGVPPHAQQLEDDHRKPKRIVVRCPHDIAVACQALHLRGLVGSYAHFASPAAARVGYLETVRVNEPDPRVRGDKQIAVVHVTNDVSGAINDIKGARRVGGHAHKKAPVGLRVVL